MNKIFVNLGSGRKGSGRLPNSLAVWRELRVDADPAVAPDIVAEATNLSTIADNSVDGVWMSHCIEHLYQHEVTKAIGEIFRILNPAGFACILAPDIQAIAGYVVEDRLHEVIYQSSAGPVTAHDMLYGFGPDIAVGRTYMAHRCGFTPTILANAMSAGGFTQFLIRRRPSLELAAIARKTPWPTDEDRNQLLNSLEL